VIVKLSLPFEQGNISEMGNVRPHLNEAIHTKRVASCLEFNEKEKKNLDNC